VCSVRLAAHALGAIVLSSFGALALQLVIYKPLHPDAVVKESAGFKKRPIVYAQSVNMDPAQGPHELLPRRPY
jgi:hypothetical protein